MLLMFLVTCPSTSHWALLGDRALALGYFDEKSHGGPNILGNPLERYLFLVWYICGPQLTVCHFCGGRVYACLILVWATPRHSLSSHLLLSMLGGFHISHCRGISVLEQIHRFPIVRNRGGFRRSTVLFFLYALPMFSDCL